MRQVRIVFFLISLILQGWITASLVSASRFGIGVREPGELSEWEFFLRYSPVKRFELSSGFALDNQKESIYQRKDWNIWIATFYHVTANAPLHLKLGARVLFHHQFVNYQYPGIIGYSEYDYDTWILEPTLAAEYFLGRHFSIGPEVGAQIIRVFRKEEGGVNYPDQKSDFTNHKVAAAVSAVFYF
jgi:hypothetical protein